MNRFSSRDSRRINELVRDSELRRYDYTFDSSDNVRQSRVPITFYNDSDEAMPPFGVGMIVSTGTMGNNDKANNVPFVAINKPSLSDSFSRNFLINGHSSVMPGEFGQGFVSGWCRAAYDTSCEEILPGDELGPSPDSWVLHLGGPGIFTSYGPIDGSFDDGIGVGIAIGLVHPVDYVWCKLAEDGGDNKSNAKVLVTDDDCSICDLAWPVYVDDRYRASATNNMIVDAGDYQKCVSECQNEYPLPSQSSQLQACINNCPPKIMPSGCFVLAKYSVGGILEPVSFGRGGLCEPCRDRCGVCKSGSAPASIRIRVTGDFKIQPCDGSGPGSGGGQSVVGERTLTNVRRPCRYEVVEQCSQGIWNSDNGQWDTAYHKYRFVVEFFHNRIVATIQIGPSWTPNKGDRDPGDNVTFTTLATFAYRSVASPYNCTQAAYLSWVSGSGFSSSGIYIL